MRRFLSAVLLAAVASTASAQNVGRMEPTARAIAALQNADGGFTNAPGGKSSVTATLSAIRILEYTGGAIPDPIKCYDYYLSCIDPATGGFAPTPGGKADVRTTALALAGLAELRLATPDIVEKSIAYLSKNAREFEEIRLIAGAIEKLGVSGPEVPRWCEEILATRNSDGSFGVGEARASETGAKIAALLRFRREIDNREGAAAAILSGQNPDGGWSPKGKTSDLPTTYKVMRALFLLKAKPDLDRLREFVEKHRNDNGTFASKPGAKDSAGTYYCTILQFWARQLDGEPAYIETRGFQPLFNGRDLDGWEGNTSLWSAKDGKIVGTSPGIAHNEFLATKADYRDFILQLSFRVRGDASANSGVQFRSVRIPGTEMSGYQADVGQGYWGCLYDESRRNRILANASSDAKESIRPNDWNHYVIRAMGDKVSLYLNGKLSVSYEEKDPSVARAGKIALQIHAGKPLTVEFKDILIQPLPSPGDGPANGFAWKTASTPSGERRYGLALPPGYDPEKAYPVIMFLHGSGERGEDGVVSSQIGMGSAALANRSAYQAILVFPQARKTWAAGSDDANAALAILDEVMKEHRCDPNKVVLTGLSMGGSGTWGIAAEKPDRFSCIVTICGTGKPETAGALAKLPTWVLVGDRDREATVLNARTMVRALQAAGGSPRYTEYRGVPHNSWDRAYADPELIAWMLTQTRGGR